MFGSQILDVAIGIIFIFLVVSVITSAIREGIEAWLKTRSSYLETGIRELLNDVNREGLAVDFYTHPLISGLYSGKYLEKTSNGKTKLNRRNLPSYIPASSFAQALMDLAARGPKSTELDLSGGAKVVSLDSIRNGVGILQNEPVQRVLLHAIDSAQGDLDRVQATLEHWFDSAMDRISGWYKRTTHWILFVVGLSVAIGLNIDSLSIADYLYRNEATREALVARAGNASTDKNFLGTNYEELKKELGTVSLPIGWNSGPSYPRRSGSIGPAAVWNDWVAPVLGWLITAFAITLGAPFWFDLLNKFMVIRSTVKPHEKSPEEASEDRQISKPRVPTGIATGATSIASKPSVLVDDGATGSSHGSTVTPTA